MVMVVMNVYHDVDVDDDATIIILISTSAGNGVRFGDLYLGLFSVRLRSPYHNGIL